MNVNMITCGGQATIPMVAAVSPRGRRCRTPRSSRRSSSHVGRPGHPRQHRRVHPDDGRRASRRSAAPSAGKAIIILNPAEPPMIMRDTIFCAVAPDADRDAIIASRSSRWRRRCRSTCPATGCSRSRSSTSRRPRPRARRRSRVFVEVEGAGDYLPPYAGNLDIMTAAATQVGETCIATGACCERRRRRLTRHLVDDPSGELDLRLTDTCLRDGSHHKRHQFTAQRGARHRRGARRRRRPGHRGDPRRRARRLVVQLRLLQDARAGADQDRGRDREARQDRVPDAPRRRHQGRHPRGAGQRRPDLPDRHPLHRGRHLDPALRRSPASSAWRPSAS